MLRGFQWGLYIWHGKLVKSKLIPLMHDLVFIQIESLEKGEQQRECFPFKPKLAATLEQVEFPEDSRLENLKIGALYMSSSGVERKVIDIYIDDEIGGVYVEHEFVNEAHEKKQTVWELGRFLSTFTNVQFKQSA